MRNLIRFRPWAMSAAALLLLAACKHHAAPPPMLVTQLAAPMVSRILPAAQGTTQRRIAVSENFAIELPSHDVQAAQQKALADCLAAGCSILNTRINRLGNGAVEAEISVRIAPDHYKAFAGNLIAPPARLVSHSETADDKTIPLLDIEKRLEAQTALRDRLSQLLAQAGTSVTDVVTIEKQLADVQGTIESETAQRNYLRTITDTVQVDVSYNGLIQQAGPFDISPVRIALQNFIPTVVQSIGDLLAAFAYALPWLPLVAVAAWIMRRLLVRRAKRARP